MCLWLKCYECYTNLCFVIVYVIVCYGREMKYCVVVMCEVGERGSKNSVGETLGELLVLLLLCCYIM